MTGGTAGNRFIAPDATIGDLTAAVSAMTRDLDRYATATDRRLDLAQITVTTRRIRDGRISVNISADLTPATERPTP